MFECLNKIYNNTIAFAYIDYAFYAIIYNSPLKHHPTQHTPHTIILYKNNRILCVKIAFNSMNYPFFV